MNDYNLNATPKFAQITGEPNQEFINLQKPQLYGIVVNYTFSKWVVQWTRSKLGCVK